MAAAVLAAAGLCAGPAHADRDALWNLVDGQCVPGQIAARDPAPCAAVDLAAGYALLKDVNGDHQYLLIPTVRVSGAEDPSARNPLAPNYFAQAWAMRSFTEARAGGALPRDGIALAVNSAAARGQDQLHIHIDCLRADVHQDLRRLAGDIGDAWAPLPAPLAGRQYQAMRVGTLESVNPFALAAEAGDPSTATIVVVAAGPRDDSGFVVLRSAVDAAVPGGGEELQDHRQCPAVLPPGPFTAK